MIPDTTLTRLAGALQPAAGLNLVELTKFAGTHAVVGGEQPDPDLHGGD